MLKKVKYIVGLVVLAGYGSMIAEINGIDWNVAFGPTAGALISAVVAYLVKEDVPKLRDYIAKATGNQTPEPPQDQ